nr:GAPDH1 [Pagiophloeus tsushimanus]
MAKVGINGFGRTGKLLLKAIFERQPTKIIPCAINDPAVTSPQHGAYVFKHDSVHGRFYGEVCFDDKHLIVNGTKIAVFKEADSKKIPWAQAGVEYVAECSGKNTTIDKAKALITGKVKKVLISAPSADAPMLVMGVNECEYKPSDKIISMASCTTNCLAPLAKIVHQKFGIREGFMTTVHSVTPFQNLLDGFSSKSWRIGRSALSNIIPTTSGAAQAVGKVIPDLQGKITGLAFRVPTPIASVVDFTVRICKCAKLQDINDEIKDASRCSMSGILCYTEEQVVSSDFIGCTCSSVYDATSSMQLSDHFFKLIAWYDNEYGYACRLADFLVFIHAKDVEAECKSKEKKNPCEDDKKK